jgi:hypothetical protein
MAVKSQQYPGCKIWYTSQAMSRSFEQMRMMMKSREFMQLVRRPYQQFPPRLEMKNGSEICFRSTDREDTLRGSGLKMVCADEAAFMEESIYFNVLLPMISDAGGEMLLCTSPSGKNWVYNLYQEGQIPANHDRIKSWLSPTSTGLRFQTEKGKLALSRIRASLPPSVYAQEYECEFLASANAVFRYVDDILVDLVPPVGPERGHNYIAGIDIGRVVDHTSVCILDIETGCVVYSEEFPLQIPHHEQAQRARNIVNAWQADAVIDATHIQAQNRERYVELYKEAIPGCRDVSLNRAVKVDMVNNLAFEIERKTVIVPKCFEKLVYQMKAYQFQRIEGSYLPVYSAPQGEHDDVLFALILAAWGRKRGWFRDQVSKGPPVGNEVGRIFWEQRNKKNTPAKL